MRRAPLAARGIALVGLALLLATASVGIVKRLRHEPPTGPQPVGSFLALAGSAGPAGFGRRTACGGILRPFTEGVAHPTLPCGARVFITFDDKTVLTQVVDRGPYKPGRQFDLTDALARLLDLSGVQTVRWSYARG